MLITVLIFIIILGVLVFVHEAGHFLIAKRSGMKVDEFGFGFPPRLVGIQKLGGKLKFLWGHKDPIDKEKTVYSINWIPLGGFVKIVGENNESESDPKSFINKPFFPRLLTLLGGVLMNVVLAWVLFSAGYMYGLPVAYDDTQDLGKHAQVRDAQLAIIEVSPDSPASKAGLLAGDIVTGINGEKFSTVPELKDYIFKNKGQAFEFSIKRITQEQKLVVQSNSEPPAGQGPTGVALATIGKLKFPVVQAIWEGGRTTISQLGAIFTGMYQLFSKGVGLESLGGPVKIAQLTGQVADLGFIYLVQFTAFLSLNLAILNSLPFPALDGGRVLFLIIEKIRRKRNNQKFEQLANTAGFLLLLLLMAVITVKDVSSLGGVGRIISKLFGS